MFKDGDGQTVLVRGVVYLIKNKMGAPMEHYLGIMDNVGTPYRFEPHHKWRPIE